MAALTNIGIGSVILNMIEDVPTTISGAALWNMVDQNIYFAEQFTGDNIGASVANVYQPAIISLTTGDVLGLMEAQGLGTRVLRLGDMTVTKGLNEMSSRQWKDNGMEKLNNLGQNITFYKSLG